MKEMIHHIRSADLRQLYRGIYRQLHAARHPLTRKTHSELLKMRVTATDAAQIVLMKQNLNQLLQLFLVHRTRYGHGLRSKKKLSSHNNVLSSAIQ